MGMKSTLQTKLAAAFAGKLADAVKTFTYTEVDHSPTYDPTSGISATPTIYSGLTGAFVDYTAREIRAANTVLEGRERIQPTDVKLIVLQNVLTVEPQKDNTVEVTGWKKMVVIAWKADPAGATWEIQLRTMKD